MELESTLKRHTQQPAAAAVAAAAAELLCPWVQRRRCLRLGFCACHASHTDTRTHSHTILLCPHTLLSEGLSHAQTSRDLCSLRAPTHHHSQRTRRFICSRHGEKNNLPHDHPEALTEATRLLLACGSPATTAAAAAAGRHRLQANARSRSVLQGQKKAGTARAGAEGGRSELSSSVVFHRTLLRKDWPLPACLARVGLCWLVGLR